MNNTDRERHWVRPALAALGVLLTVAVSLQVYATPGVYWARTVVRIYPPTSAPVPNALEEGSGSLVQVAGIVARQVEPAPFETMPVSPDVTLADQGVRNGSRVFQASVGGQWQANFDSPALLVDVVAPSRAEVENRSDALVSRIQDSLLSMQRSEDVSDSAMITALPTTPTAQVVYSDGGRRKAAALTMVLGMALTGAFLHLERLLRARRRLAA